MSAERPLKVLVVGATGVFGSRLAELAAQMPGVAITLAARSLEPLTRLAARHGCASVRLVDRDRVTPAELEGFDLVIDCAGPFQNSHCRLIDAAIAAGVDYCDLADGREFVARIVRFDAAAKAAGVRVVCGASSIPALSHAVLDRLVEGWSAIDRIRVGIFPGNRAPRGRSVVEAILSYVGKPVRVFKQGGWREEAGWSLQGRMDCGAAGRRWASVCDTPEQDLLVARYRPRQSAEFVAGLELPILHIGLWLLSLPVRIGLVRSLRGASGFLLWIARMLQWMGSDRGAMIVEAAGVADDGQQIEAGWRLDATGNRGPYVPVLAALVMIGRFRDGMGPAPGACACSGILTIEEFEPWLKQLGFTTTWWNDRPLAADSQTPRDFRQLVGAGAPAVVEAHRRVGRGVGGIPVHYSGGVAGLAVAGVFEGVDRGEREAAATVRREFIGAVAIAQRAGPHDAGPGDGFEDAR